MKYSGGTVKLSQAKYPFQDVAIHLRFDNDTLRIPQADFSAGDSAIRASGIISRWQESPRAELELRSPYLNLDALLPNAGGQQQTGNGPPSWLRAATVSASMNIERAQYQELVLTDVAGHALASDGLLRLNDVTAHTDEGLFRAQFTGRWPEGMPPSLEGFLKVTGIPVEDVLSLVGQESRLKGRLSVNGRALAEEAGPLIESLTTLTDIRILIEDGRMYQSPIIARMLKLVNAPALVGDDVALDRDGIPFDRLSGLFAIHEGVVEMKELSLDGPVLKIRGAGTYEAAADRLDLAMAMNPLQSYSSLLGKIPLIGRLLSGERRGLGATLYEVTGPLKDPNVRILPLESLAGGVSGFARLAYDMLVNAAKLPLDLLTTPEAIVHPDQN